MGSQRLAQPGERAQRTADAVTETGKWAGIVVVGTELLTPVVGELARPVSPRLVALSICVAIAATFHYEGTRIRKGAQLALAALVIFCGAFGANKGISEVRSGAGAVVARAEAQDGQPEPTPVRRPLDEW